MSDYETDNDYEGRGDDDRLEDIKREFDRNFEANQETRRRAADDRVFAWVTQWDDTLLEDTENAYRGEFNIIRKGTRHIIADLRANPVQVDFEPVDQAREDGAEILDGLYLTDDRRNTSLEAYDNASLEAVDCGVGGWELYTEYESKRNGEKQQVIRRRPIYEANNVSFPDCNAKRLDKSDAMNWGILTPYSATGYCRLVKELTGEDKDVEDLNPNSFAQPEQSYVFPWISGQSETIYVCRWYEKTLVKDKVLTMEDPGGNIQQVLNSQVVDIIDELMDGGYQITDEKVIERYSVTLTILSGEEVLSDAVEIAGENIPIVHTYGERTFVEGEEIWEGAIRLAKDPQRLRNFMLSYLAEIATRSPRPKPMFTPEEVAGHEWMYDKSGAENNFAYYMYNAIDGNGNPIERSREMLPRAEMPAGMVELSQEARQAVEDVVNPGVPEEFADNQMSGYAIEQLTARYDQQSLVYQQNMKHAKRYDAQVYAGMATIVYDTPRTVTLTARDGTRKQQELLSTVMDQESGNIVVLNDLTNAEFEVFAEIGQSYTSKRERTRDHLENLAEKMAALDPNLSKILAMQALTLVDGVGLDDIRDYVREQLLMSGVRKPETEEEMQMVQEAQQNQQPDAMTIAAQAEQRKAEADNMNAQTNQIKAQTEQFKAETGRFAAQVDAEVAGSTVKLNEAKAGAEGVKAFSNLRGSAGVQQPAANEPAAPVPGPRRMRYNPESRNLESA